MHEVKILLLGKARNVENQFQFTATIATVTATATTVTAMSGTPVNTATPSHPTLSKKAHQSAFCGFYQIRSIYNIYKFKSNTAWLGSKLEYCKR